MFKDDKEIRPFRYAHPSAEGDKTVKKLGVVDREAEINVDEN
jgi:hypothetical protein